MTHRRTLFFEPLDVLLFRDHRPFDAGYNVLAESTFPGPSVFLGCLRTALFRRAGADFYTPDEHFGIRETWARDLLGGRNRRGSLQMRGPLLADGPKRGSVGTARPLFRMPLDLVAAEDGQAVSCPWCHAALETRYSVLASWDLTTLPGAPKRLHWSGKVLVPVARPLPWTGTEVKKGTSGILLTAEGMERYFAAEGAAITFTPEQIAHERCVIELEDRVGIARDPESLTAAEGMFYIKRPFRIARGKGFAVDVVVPGGAAAEAVQALDGAVLPLGGKAHRARIHVLDGPLLPRALAPTTRAAGRRKLYLATPLVLDSRGTAWPVGVRCWVTERAGPVGGYDLAARAPKPLRRALPAGTVLHLEGLSAADALAQLGGPEGETGPGVGGDAVMGKDLQEGVERG